MKAIVYESFTGHTKAYAELLSKSSGIRLFSLEEASSKLNREDDVLYMGWLRAEAVSGYKKAAKKYNVCAVCAVGLARIDEKTEAAVKKMNNIFGIPFFALPGGVEMDKLPGYYKIPMLVLRKFMVRSLKKKPVLTTAEEDQLDAWTHEGSRVNAEELEPVLLWVRTNFKT